MEKKLGESDIIIANPFVVAKARDMELRLKEEAYERDCLRAQNEDSPLLSNLMNDKVEEIHRQRDNGDGVYCELKKTI